LNPDERSTGALIRNALIKQSALNSESNIDRSSKVVIKQQSDGFPRLEIRSSPGVSISNNGLSDLIEYYSANSTIIYLKETAVDINGSGMDIKEDDGDLTFVLSDHMDLTADEEKLIREHSKLEFSIGPEILHTDHCIILVHNFLDKKRRK
jgi:tRNA (pseudouridine54-N1)-methyltransferase